MVLLGRCYGLPTAWQVDALVWYALKYTQVCLLVCLFVFVKRNGIAPVL